MLDAGSGARHPEIMELKKWRLGRGYSLSQAAVATGIPHAQTFHRIETGDYMPGPDLVVQLHVATSGVVTDREHRRTWERAHPEKVADAKVAARKAMRLGAAIVPRYSRKNSTQAGG